jgi:hypothetical protein
MLNLITPFPFKLIVAIVTEQQVATVTVVSYNSYNFNETKCYNFYYSQFNSSADNPLDAGIGSMIMSVVELVDLMHPVCAIIDSGVLEKN